MSWPLGPSDVYRLYDSADVLLYIGVTEDTGARFATHAATKPWWPDVDQNRTRITSYDSREEAEAAENEAIRTEHAQYNVAGSPWAPKPRKLDEDEATVAELRANLTEAVNRVRLMGRPIVIVDRTRERKPTAALVPASLLDLIEKVGGMNAATEILLKSLTATTAP